MSDTSIQWTDKTWNPVRGCSVISPGCVNCYAMKQAHRFSGVGRPYEGLTKQTKAGPQWTGKVSLAERQLTDPLRWKKPQRVFVNSMSDLFHESMPDEWMDKVFAVMAMTPQHTYQILTKRASRMLEYMQRRERVLLPTGCNCLCHDVDGDTNIEGGCEHCEAKHIWPLPNVWLGVSVENQKYADERIPLLLQTPAAMRFISAEPLLGPVNLDQFSCGECLKGHHRNASTKAMKAMSPCCGHCDEHADPEHIYWLGQSPSTRASLPHLDWVIVGGESGNGARPFDVAWARSIIEQCAAAKVACFVKQLGALHNSETKTSDRKGGVIAEFPLDLQVREFPQVTA